MKSLSELSSLTEEALTGNLVVQAFNKQEDIITSIDESIENNMLLQKHLSLQFFSIYPSIRFITQIAFVTSAVMSAILVIKWSSYFRTCSGIFTIYYSNI